MRALVGFLAVVLGGAECARTPTEDFRQPSIQALNAPDVAAASADVHAVPAAGGFDGRCVALTPSLPPNPVPRGPASGCPVDPEGNAASAPGVRTTFVEAAGVAVEAELVRNDHDTTRGLMYRKSLPEDGGMLFDLGVRADHKFWMHNTCIPLDMLFVDNDGLIVGIVENVPTLNDEARSVGCPSRWVLEVNAGWSRRHGVKAAFHMTLPR
jgi:uncharacterized membrane protein (UPF0127 family)